MDAVASRKRVCFNQKDDRNLVVMVLSFIEYPDEQ